MLPRRSTQTCDAGRATERLRARAATHGRPGLLEICPRPVGTSAANDERATARTGLQDLGAGRFNTIVFRPVFEFGSSRRPRPKSTWSQRRCRISRSGDLVKIRRRSAAAASGESKVRWFSSLARCFDFSASPSSRHAMPTVSPSRMAAPSCSSSSGVRKRSRRSSGSLPDFLGRVAVFRTQAASLGERIEAANDSEEAIGLVRSIADLTV